MPPVLVKEINGIRIEKIKRELGAKKKYPNGTIRLIKQREKTAYRALAPNGLVLYEAEKFRFVNQFACTNRMFC